MLCIKVRNISTSLLILQEVQHAASGEVPSFIYNKLVTTTPSNEISQLITEFSWSHTSTIVGVIVLVLLIVAVYLLYRSRSHKGPLIALEVTSREGVGEVWYDSSCATALMPIILYNNHPLNFGHFSFKISLFIFGRYLGTFSVTDKQTETILTLPSKFTLNPFAHRKLTKLLQQPFMAYVVILHSNYCMHFI